MHSAWIGEHHFNSLGVLSCPDLVLAYIAARTKHIRLAPAVTVLPLHHPIRVAEQWATLDLLSGGRVDFAARPRLRPARVSATERLVRGQPRNLRRRDGGGAPSMVGRPADLVSRQALPVRRCRDHSETGAAPAAGLCRLVLAALDRACRSARLRPYRRAFRGGDDLWR